MPPCQTHSPGFLGAFGLPHRRRARGPRRRPPSRQRAAAAPGERYSWIRSNVAGGHYSRRAPPSPAPMRRRPTSRQALRRPSMRRLNRKTPLSPGGRRPHFSPSGSAGPGLHAPQTRHSRSQATARQGREASPRGAVLRTSVAPRSLPRPIGRRMYYTRCPHSCQPDCGSGRGAFRCFRPTGRP